MSAVYFEIGAPDGLRSRFLADAPDFECWLRELAGEFPGQYPPAVLAKLADIALRGADALLTADAGEARLIDGMMHDYWNFCTMTSRHGEKDITPSARHRYPVELAQLLPDAGGDVRGYYRRLFAGDSLAQCGGHAYRPVDGVFRWSWLLPHEVVDFGAKLQQYVHLLNGAQDGMAGLCWILTALRLAEEQGGSLLVSVA